jgi:hypothetical protein
MRIYYDIMVTPTLRQLLKNYKEAYATIQNMNVDDAITHLIKLDMDSGLCKYAFHKFNVKDITEWLPEDFDEFSYYWNTPFQYYQEGKHPKLGLIARISHVEKELELLEIPY